ncbi:hypothetical protein J4732_10450 [Serratia marcescens]|uniref:Uncharacterized protein n=1 Tax=Serratia marcescens TaxID=615 RepID=A0A939NRG1_SERMA|nr:hypothetical protein [Serratia marcescens]
MALNPLFIGAARKITTNTTHVWVGNDRAEIEPDIQLSITQAIQIARAKAASLCIVTMPRRSGAIHSMAVKQGCK